MTSDDAAKEIIKALERGALKATDAGIIGYEYKHCPECLAEVEIVNQWNAGDYGDFGGTIKCKACAWRKDFRS